jgi:hypothetical protein
VASRSWVIVDLIIISALESLVAEEVNRRIRHTPRLLPLVLEMLQAIRLIPPSGEDIEGDLPADGISTHIIAIRSSPCVQIRGGTWVAKDNSREPQVGKLLLQLLDKLLPHPMFLVVLLIRIPLLHARIPAHGAHVNHAIPELHERAPLHR